MKLWILVAVALLLLVVALWSESFTTTSTIVAPPYDDNQKRRIYGMMSAASQAKLTAKAKTANPTLDTVRDAQRLGAIAGGYVSDAVGGFFTTYYAPLQRTLTSGDVDAFIATRTGDADTKALEKEAVTAYFLNQAGPHSSGYIDIVTAMGQNWNPPPTATGPTGTTGPAGAGAGPTGGAAPGPTGGVGPTGGAAGPTGGAGTGTGGFQGTWTTTGGSTTGYGTTFTTAPTQGLLGPAFTSFGDPSPSGNTLDSSKYTSYPQVLGGVPETSTTTVPGAGVISGTKTLDLPSLESLGASAQAQFFPFSRTPGDMEKIPDPFRVSQMFNTASYSSKTEPVPFLTDFSAFQR